MASENNKEKELLDQIHRFGDAVAWAEFVIDVEEMRAAQDSFFKTREKSALNKARALERVVDLKIKKIRSKQTNLFTS